MSLGASCEERPLFTPKVRRTVPTIFLHFFSALLPRPWPTRSRNSMHQQSAGLALAVLSAVFNGSFVSFSKFEDAKIVHPFVFNLYLALGVFFSSCSILPFLPLLGSPPILCPLGGLAGLLFCLASSLSFVAVSNVGVSSGQGVFGACAILISFLWGTLGPAPIGLPVVSLPLSLLATSLLLVGVGGIVNCELIARRLKGGASTSSPQSAALAEPLHGSEHLGGSEQLSGSEQSPLLTETGAELGAAIVDAPRRLVGFVAAVLVGIFGGSILVPLGFLGHEYQGIKALAFLPSFGMGSLVGSAALCAAWLAIGRGKSTERQHSTAPAESIREQPARARSPAVAEPNVASGGRVPPPTFGRRGTLMAGMASGLTWNLGNVCQLLAQSVFMLPYGIAYPMLQASLVVAGILGIACFGEIRNQAAIVVFFSASGLIVVGAALLGMYGPSPAAR